MKEKPDSKATGEKVFEKPASGIFSHYSTKILDYRSKKASGENPVFCRYALKILNNVIDILDSERKCGKEQTLFPVVGGEVFGEKGCLGSFSAEILAMYLEPEWICSLAFENDKTSIRPISGHFDEKHICFLPEADVKRIREFEEHFSAPKVGFDNDMLAENLFHDDAFPDREWQELVEKGAKLARAAALAGNLGEVARNEMEAAMYANPEAFASLRKNLCLVYGQRVDRMDDEKFLRFLSRYEKAQRFFAPIYGF